jgi:GH35 family endo-1,4-beta-xylanase
MLVGVGMSAAMYNASAKDATAYKTLCDENFQLFTTGNAMKMDALVGNSGALNFATIDEMFGNMPSDMKLYGHNFIWYSNSSRPTSRVLSRRRWSSRPMATSPASSRTARSMPTSAAG